MTTYPSVPDTDPASAIATPSAEAQMQVIPVINEHLEVRREVVETGAATRVRKIHREEAVNVEVSLSHDEISVERVPANRFVAERFGERQEGDTLIVPVFEEVTVVEKRLLLKEEVRITVSRKQTASMHPVTLAREEAVIERRDSPTGEWREDLSAASDGRPPRSDE